MGLRVQSEAVVLGRRLTQINADPGVPEPHWPERLAQAYDPAPLLAAAPSNREHSENHTLAWRREQPREHRELLLAASAVDPFFDRLYPNRGYPLPPTKNQVSFEPVP